MRELRFRLRRTEPRPEHLRMLHHQCWAGCDAVQEECPNNPWRLHHALGGKAKSMASSGYAPGSYRTLKSLCEAENLVRVLRGNEAMLQIIRSARRLSLS